MLPFYKGMFDIFRKNDDLARVTLIQCVTDSISRRTLQTSVGNGTEGGENIGMSVLCGCQSLLQWRLKETCLTTDFSVTLLVDTLSVAMHQLSSLMDFVTSIETLPYGRQTC